MTLSVVFTPHDCERPYPVPDVIPAGSRFRCEVCTSAWTVQDNPRRWIRLDFHDSEGNEYGDPGEIETIGLMEKPRPVKPGEKAAGGWNPWRHR